MANFEGTWVDTSSDATGFDQFMDAIGLSKEKEKYRTSVTTTTFKLDGNKISLIEKTSLTEGPDEITEYKDAEFGKECKVKSSDGSNIKGTITKISDNEIHQKEKHSFALGLMSEEFQIVRTIDADVMNVKTTAVSKNVSLYYTMKKME